MLMSRGGGFQLDSVFVKVRVIVVELISKNHVGRVRLVPFSVHMVSWPLVSHLDGVEIYVHFFSQVLFS